MCAVMRLCGTCNFVGVAFVSFCCHFSIYSHPRQKCLMQIGNDVQVHLKSWKYHITFSFLSTRQLFMVWYLMAYSTQKQ